MIGIGHNLIQEIKILKEYGNINPVSIVRSGHYQHLRGRLALGLIRGPPVACFSLNFDRKNYKVSIFFSFHFLFIVMSLFLNNFKCVNFIFIQVSIITFSQTTGGPSTAETGLKDIDNT